MHVEQFSSVVFHGTIQTCWQLAKFLLQLGRNKSRTNVYTIVTLHFWSAVCCFTCLSCGCCTIIYRYITYLSCICFTRLLLHVSGLYLFQSYLSFHTVIIYNSGFFYSFVSVCFLVLDHEAVPDLSLSVSLKSSMIMGTGLQIRLFLHDFYTRFLYTIL